MWKLPPSIPLPSPPPLSFPQLKVPAQQDKEISLMEILMSVISVVTTSNEEANLQGDKGKLTKVRE